MSKRKHRIQKRHAEAVSKAAASLTAPTFNVRLLAKDGSALELNTVRAPSLLPLPLSYALALGVDARLSKATIAKAHDHTPVEYGMLRPDLQELFVSKAGGGEGIVLMRRKEDGSWSASMGKTLVPYVLTKQAVEESVMPPDGVSGLPASLERVVPAKFQYWKRVGKEAEAVRNALVQSELFAERLIKVVDGEMRLCVERLYLYEPDGSSSDEPVIAKRLVDVVVELIPTHLSVSGVVSMFDANGKRAVRKAEESNALTIVSPPSDDEYQRAVSLLLNPPDKSFGGPFLLEWVDSPKAREEMGKLGRVFTVEEHAPGTVFVSNFAVNAMPGLAFVDEVAKAKPDAKAAPVTSSDSATRKAASKKTVDFQGLTVKVDRPKGFVQKGEDENGIPWERTYQLDYGFIPSTSGGDGEELDVFLGPNEKAPLAFWVHQNKADGSFDEFKVMLGFDDATAAKAAYVAHVPERFFGDMLEAPVAHMKALFGLEPEMTGPADKGLDIVLNAYDSYYAAASKRRDLSKRTLTRVVTVKGEAAEERYVLGIVLEPETVDAQKDIYSAQTIRDTAFKFMEDYKTIGLMHKGAINDKVKILESFIAPADFEVQGQVVKAGTWLLGVRVLDDGLWKAVKSGDITGFSIGGSALRKPDEEAPAAAA